MAPSIFNKYIAYNVTISQLHYTYLNLQKYLPTYYVPLRWLKVRILLILVIFYLKNWTLVNFENLWLIPLKSGRFHILCILTHYKL